MNKSIGIAATVVAAALFAVAAAPVAGGSVLASVTTKPIDKQNCKELAKTNKRNSRALAPGKSVETMREAMRNSDKLVDRLNQLGGCLSKKAKTATAPTGPSGAAGDAGVTPETQAAYLLVANQPELERFDPGALINAGLGFCSDLDKGTSIATVAKTVIKAFRTQGLNGTDSEWAFYTIAIGAAGNGPFSFCNRHADKVEEYENSQVQ